MDIVVSYAFCNVYDTTMQFERKSMERFRYVAQMVCIAHTRFSKAYMFKEAFPELNKILHTNKTHADILTKRT